MESLEKTHSNSADCTVVAWDLENISAARRIINSVEQQTVKPERLIFVVNQPAKQYQKLIKSWKLPIKPDSLISSTEDDFISRLKEKITTEFFLCCSGQFSWDKNYLKNLLQSLLDQPEAHSSSGIILLPDHLTDYQKSFWVGLNHLFSGQNFNPGKGRIDSIPAGSLLRKKTLEPFENLTDSQLPGSTRELLTLIESNPGKQLFQPRAIQYYHPPTDWRKFTEQIYRRGQFRGGLANRGWITNMNQWREDKLFTLWTFLLCWNPAGWGIILLDLLLAAGIAINQRVQNKTDLRLFFWFLLIHFASWTGWLSRRFKISTSKKS